MVQFPYDQNNKLEKKNQKIRYQHYIQKKIKTYLKHLKQTRTNNKSATPSHKKRSFGVY